MDYLLEEMSKLIDRKEKRMQLWQLKFSYFSEKLHLLQYSRPLVLLTLSERERQSIFLTNEMPLNAEVHRK